jgi:hypothetical protein
MSHANEILRPSQGKLTAVLLIAVAAVVLLLSTQGSTAKAETCVGGSFCAWTGTFYSGEERNMSCSGGTGTTFELRSAQNHCGVNVTIGWWDGVNTNWKACMAPGGLRPEPGRFNTITPNGC